MSRLPNWKDAPKRTTHYRNSGCNKDAHWLLFDGSSWHWFNTIDGLPGYWKVFDSAPTTPELAGYITRPVEFSGDVVTTGIKACKDAHSKGFRVQCLHKAICDYRDLTRPQWNGDTDSYRIHPDDVPKYVAWYNGQHVAPVSPPQPVSTARPHAELIKAWADGAEIEYRCKSTGNWIDVPIPSWLVDTKYRIKPQPEAKPKIPRAVFEKAAARRKVKYNARIKKLVDQITALHEQKAAVSEHYVEKQRRAGVFSKEHVE